MIKRKELLRALERGFVKYVYVYVSRGFVNFALLVSSQNKIYLKKKHGLCMMNDLYIFTNNVITKSRINQFLTF